MSKNWRTLLITPLNGLTLSTLFFYPLLTAVSGDNINFLHWALIDSAEAISSWLFVGSVFTALIYSGERIFSKKINTVWTLLLIEFGAFMALGGLIRNEPLYSLLQTNRQSLISFTLITSALNLALIAWIYLKKTNQPQEIISNLLLLASPLNLIFIFNNLGVCIIELIIFGTSANLILT